MLPHKSVVRINEVMSTVVLVSGEKCTDKLHMVYGAAGTFSDDWKRYKIEVNVVVVDK